jgi:hypothetical protein
MRGKITKEMWEQVKTAVASGIPLREIARNMVIPAGTILSHAKREGWSREIQSAKALAKREDALLATPVEAVAKTMQQRGERHVERMAGVSERGVDLISDALPFGRLWYGEPDADANAIDCAKFFSRSHDSMLRKDGG